MLFDVLNPILLIMPVVMGSILGYLVGLYKYRVQRKIDELQSAKENLTRQVELQTKELQKRNDDLKKSLLIDPLTGLGNRIKLKEILKLESESLSVNYTHLSVLMIDIDYFKKYNDFYGHLDGDEVLKSIGAFFRTKMLNNSNTIMRFGGEEFIAILPDCDQDLALQTAQEFIDGVQLLNIEHKASECNEKLTISIGVHTTNAVHMLTKNELIKTADEALYIAKEQGRNRHHIL